ncbi:type I polyketide synthase [Goodfellowiella coeruleoviolacea]|uniref:Acyl transferase domain-containing protein n=1 Tax=Goodfellowiella coeruleoviolacea TaxID=334858 RepID=A0AAE3G923_9PSEU|nr:type I polyketide synthase [Goodfellowiella coeruleoviolacea]MCP2163946.1 Acyl transferase domain-containing protein [Goodfellowiella coeruleoviolacea]
MTDASERGSAIAVIGMAGRFPGADDVDQFWANLVAGRESVLPVSDEEYLAAGGSRAGLTDPHTVRVAATIDGIELFDAAFFGYSAADAALIDPQHRLFLECCYHALENAGQDPSKQDSVVGVYGGASSSTYYVENLWPRLAGRDSGIEATAAKVGNIDGTLTTRVSYELNLTGPSMAVQTACSTSLVAVHLACQDLLDFRCDLALVGGASVNVGAKRGYRYVEGGPLPADGHVRTFDADAAGTVGGDGVGVVVLKRLADALADGDRVRAVILGSAINNDGHRKVGFVAPSTQGQVDAILAAQAAAGVSADEIGYVEAHGTATPVGDPIEIAALSTAFAESTQRRQFCAIGSAKTNIGHTAEAAGVAGLIKLVLALEHRMIPASLHYRAPNPLIDFTETPFYVNAELSPWDSDGRPRVGAVSSFGIGGTNAHVIVAEAPAAPPSSPAGEWVALPLSARTPSALGLVRERLADHLAADRGLNLADVAHTLHSGRKALDRRCVVVCRDLDDAVTRLRQPHPALAPAQPGVAPEVAFLLPGGGGDYPGMGRQLYDTEPLFRADIDHCAEILRPVLGADLRATLYGDAPRDWTAGFVGVVATEYALARLVMSFGVRPTALIGHSLGEYTAACLAGVYSLADMLPLVAERVRLLEGVGGAMISVPLGESDLRGYLTERVSLAAVNAPTLCVLAGPVEDIAEVERKLAIDDVPTQRLRVPSASHSAMTEPFLGRLAATLSTVEFHAPAIPIMSNLTGTWVTDEQVTSVDYWLRHTSHTVRFAEGLAQLCQAKRPALVEVGPGRVLARLARMQFGDTHPVATAMGHARDERCDRETLLGALGQLWCQGVDVDWTAVHSSGQAGATRQRVPLPGYPFERKRYWVDPLPPHRSAPEPLLRLPAERDRLCAAEQRVRERVAVNRPPADAVRALDRLSDLYLCAYLSANGVSLAPGQVHDRAALVDRLCPATRCRRMVDTLLYLLTQSGVLVEEDSGGSAVLRVADPPADHAAEIAALEQELRVRFPDQLGAVDLARHCVGQYHRVFTGEIEAHEVLRPDGEFDITDEPGADLVNNSDVVVYRDLLAEEVARLVRAAGGRRVRVLEVGAGRGLLSWHVVEALRELSTVEFHFTDIGRSFVLAAQRRAAEQGLDCMSFGVLDIGTDPTAQGYPAGGFDIVLAYNVLHATPQVRDALHNVRQLVAPGGVLFVLEASALPRITLLPAVLKGWEPAADDFRQHLPLIPAEAWPDLVADAGYAEVGVLPPTPEQRAHVDHVLVVATTAEDATLPTGAPAEAPAGIGTPARSAFNSRPELPTEYVAPRTELEEVVARQWAEVLGLDRVGIEDNFFALGGESLLALQLVARMRDELGVVIPVRKVMEHTTVAALAGYCARQLAGTAEGVEPDLAKHAYDVLLPLRPEGQLPPLFCVHPAGGLSWRYAGLVRHIHADRPIYGLQARGLDGTEPLADSVLEVAEDCVRQIRSVQPHGPYHLLGWSFGGFAAHAMATLLEQAGERVALLAMLDAVPVYLERVPDEREIERGLLAVLLNDAGHTVDVTGDAPLDRARVLELIRRDGGGFAVLDDGEIDLLVRVLRNNARILLDHRAGTFSGDLLFFTATRSHPADEPTAEAWRPYVAGQIDNHDVDCDHYSLTLPEPMAVIGAVLDAALRRCSSTPGRGGVRGVRDER